jgi:hypothetical protein
MSAPELDTPATPPDAATSRQLFRLGSAALAVGIVGLVYKSPLGDSFLLGMGAFIMVFSALPALNWARRGDAHFPVFEMFMLTAIPFYAVPLLAGHSSVLRFSEEATWTSAIGISIFQLSAIATFATTRSWALRNPALKTSLLPQSAFRYSQAGIWLNVLYLYIYGFTQLIPNEFSTPIRAVFFGVGTVSLFVEARRWGAGELQILQKVSVTVGVLIQMTFLFRELYLIVGISVVLLALIGFISTSRRVPILLIVLVFPVVAVLHNGKSIMRRQYWENKQPLPELIDVPAFFETWFVAGLTRQPNDDEEASASLAGRLFERASLFQMLCLVAQDSPDDVPYLMGESYKYVPSQLIPSFLWPDKPSSLLSNILLAVHYRLVSADSSSSVSIAFGMIAEAYANFGLLGCVGLGALLGFAYKRICTAAVGQPQFSALGLLTILLAAWSFQVEQIFATWFVSLVQAAAVVVGGPLIFRILFRQD